MLFRDVTDQLFDRVAHKDLARRLGVSVATIRQARLCWTAQAHRPPPKKWQDAALEIARERAAHYERLVALLSVDA